MKNSILIAALLLAVNSTFAQTTAQNWTKTDCDGNAWTLFDQLDKGKVVLLQFDMMNCGLCTSAALYTDQIYSDYQTSHPGKMLMFSMGYDNYTVCSDMSSWKSSNSFTFNIIEKCPSDVAYYGGMGMPTIVVVGSSSHKVYYKKLQFKASDDAAIRSAIDKALAEATGIEESKNLVNSISIYPNPADKITYIGYTLTKATDVKIEVYDILGKKIITTVSEKQNAGEHKFELNTKSLVNGIYFVNVNGNRFKLQVSN